MRKTILLLALAGVFLIRLLNCVSAYAVYDYNPYNDKAYIYVGAGRPYSYGYSDYDPASYTWDDDDLRWEKDPINEWIQNGNGAREEFIRLRAVDEVERSFNDRYRLSYGRSSGDVHYYNRYTPDVESTSASNWRYKEAYDPSIHGRGANNENYYYYQPRYDYQKGEFNWRY